MENEASGTVSGLIRKIQSCRVPPHPVECRSIKRINELRTTKRRTVDGSPMHRGAGENSELAHHLHLPFTGWDACCNKVVLAVHYHETQQNAGQLSRPRGQSAPCDFSQARPP